MTQLAPQSGRSGGLNRVPRHEGGVILGVCAGLAGRWDANVWVVRGAAVVALLVGVGLPLYVLIVLATPAPSAGAGAHATSLIVLILMSGAAGGLRLLGWAGLAFALSVPCVVLSVVGLGWVPLVIAALLIGLAWVWDARAAWVATLVALSGAAGALVFPAIDQWNGVRSTYGDGAPLEVIGYGASIIADPASETDQETRSRYVDGYRQGIGPVEVDLRDFKPKPGSNTRIRVQSDTDNVVVALPQRRCLRLVIRYREIQLLPRFHASVAALAGWTVDRRNALTQLGPGRDEGSAAWLRTQHYWGEPRDHTPPTFIAFSKSMTGDQGTYVRDVAEAGAPTITIDAAVGAQLIVRDYPDNESFSFQEQRYTTLDGPGDRVRTPGAWPTDLAFQSKLSAREVSLGSRYPARRLSQAERVELRRQQDRWAQAQAQRLAGPCASRAELEDRVGLARTDYVRTAADDGTHQRTTWINGLGERFEHFEQRRRTGPVDWRPVGS